MVPTIKCEICNEIDSKYKCPICRTRYCSVACCKVHKESPNCKPTIPQLNKIVEHEKQTTYKPASHQFFPTEDTVTSDKLEILGGSAELRALLGNPHLQAILKGVDSASNASNAMENAMQEPIFTEFVNTCMKIVEPQ